MATLPAHLQKVSNWGLVAAGKKGIGASRGAHLSISGNDFTLVEENGQESKGGSFDANLGGRYIRAVVVAVSEVNSRIFYDGPWQPGQEYYNPPACHSEDGITPSAEAEKPQNKTCSMCPQAAWGSKQTATGSKSQACQDGKRIVLYVPDKGFYGFRITPGSFKNWQSYLNTLEGQGVEPQYFLTRLQFVSQGVLAFTADAYVTEAMVEAYNQPAQIKQLLKPVAPVVAQPAPIAAPVVAQPAQIAQIAAPDPPAGFVLQEKAPVTPKRTRATKAEMEVRRAVAPIAVAPSVPVAPTPAAIFGQATPDAVEDPALKAALAAAFGG